MTKTNFEINPQLDSSSIFVSDLSLCQVRLKNDRRFPWVVLIPRRPDLVEIFDLSAEDQNLLWSEITRVAQHMHQNFQAYKMNIEILGNRVRQLHIHIIARHDADAAWPNSVLNHGTTDPYSPDEITKRVQEISF
jgi:diadenosine tetraphosphate (Ap4A) HIT family hydrolase